MPRSQKTKKIKGKLLTGLMLVCMCSVAFFSFQLYQQYKMLHQSKDTLKKIEKVVQTEAPKDEKWHPTSETFSQMKDINPDYVGWLLFDSELISEPILQGESDTTYLRTDIYGNYDIWGSVFMDSQNTPEDANLLILGHAWTENKQDTTKFSPLQNMTEQAFYDANASFKIYYADHVDSYQIVSCFIGDTADEAFRFDQLRFSSDEEKNSWFSQVINKSSINPEKYNLTQDARFCTLQTCVDDWSTLRYVIVGLLTDTSEIQ